jgi:DNA replication initiation complex subunit (GINS family)
MELKEAEKKFKHLLHNLLKDNADAIIGMRKLLAGESSSEETNQELKNPPAPNETPDVPAPEENTEPEENQQ